MRGLGKTLAELLKVIRALDQVLKIIHHGQQPAR
jgi:hypothetical protein